MRRLSRSGVAVSLSSVSKNPEQDDRYFVGDDSSNLLQGSRWVSRASYYGLVKGDVGSLSKKRWNYGVHYGRNWWRKGIAAGFLEDESYERLGGRLGSVEMQGVRVEGTTGTQGSPGHCCSA